MGKLRPDDRPGFKMLGVVEGYDRWAATYDGGPNPLIDLEQPVTLAMIGEVQGRRVLDLGCGTGRYCVLLAERGAEVLGVDPSPGMLERARARVSGNAHVKLMLGTLDGLRLPNEQFDGAVCALTLSHLPELEPTLRETARVLKAGGWLVISDIHPYWPVSGHDYTEFFDEAGQEYRIPEYPHLVEEFWRLFSELGFHLEDIHEPTIDARLIERFPTLEGYQGIPLAIALKARKGSRHTALDEARAFSKPSLLSC